MAVMAKPPKFKAAAAHVALVFLDGAATVAKACDVIAEAALAVRYPFFR